MSRIRFGRALGLVSAGFIGGHIIAIPMCGSAFVRDRLHRHVDMAFDALEWIPNSCDSLRRSYHPLQESEIMRQRMKELKDRAREYQDVSKQVEALIQRDEKRLAEASCTTHASQAKNEQHAVPFDIPELHDQERLNIIESVIRRDDASERAYHDSEKRLKQLQKESKNGEWPENLPKLKSRPWPAKDLHRLSEDEMQLEIEWRARSDFAWNRMYEGVNRRVKELELEQRSGKMSAATQKVLSPSVYFKKAHALLSNDEMDNEIEHCARKDFAGDCLRRQAEENHKKRKSG